MKRVCLSILLTFSLFGASARAEDVPTSVVLDGLNNPSGLAVQPGTGHLFVSDSGNGKIVRVIDGKAEDVVVGFGKDVYGKGPMYDIGPLGLAFLDETTLIVGGGDLPDGEELLRVFKVPAAGADAIKADAATASFALAANDETKGEGNFYALAISKEKDAVYVTSNGDDNKGWVAKGTIKDGTVTAFERSIATKEAVNVDAPVGIVTSPDGQIVVGQMGEITVPNDGLLSFYSAKDGKLLLNLETGLSDITGLAYSPKKQLYAIDFSWHDTTLGGLFQLVAEQKEGAQSVAAKKVTSLDKPTALAFGPDGSLYITVIAEPNQGKVLKIAPGL